MKAKDLHALLVRDIKLFKALAPEIKFLSQTEARLSAPLSANSNHLGTAFGGSQYSLAVLTCYSLVVGLLEDGGLLASHEVVVKQSSSHYKRPVATDYEAQCLWPDNVDQAQWLKELKTNGRIGLELKVELKSQTKLCSHFEAEFIVFRRSQKS